MAACCPAWSLTLLTTPAIVIDALDQGGTLTFEFDSSWRPEDTQNARIFASFDGGALVEVLEFSSDSNSPNFKPDATTETVSFSVAVPGDASEVAFTFRYAGTNDWWWAIDNINVTGDAGSTAFSEDFEGVTLGDSIDEGLPGPASNVWTETGPSGWIVDDTGVPTFTDPVFGVKEWEGWAWVDADFWSTAAGDQRRSQFTGPEGFASNIVMVADPDEWDDESRGVDEFTESPDDLGLYNAFVTTNSISLGENPQANSMRLFFASSWRPEGRDNGNLGNTNNQTAVLEVSFDGGEFVRVLEWQSSSIELDELGQPVLDGQGQQIPLPTVGEGGQGNQFGFKPDEFANEFISLDIDNPDGAAAVVFRYGLINASNDWWWAVDELVLSTINTGGGLALPPNPFGVSAESFQQTAFPSVDVGDSDFAISYVVQVSADSEFPAGGTIEFAGGPGLNQVPSPLVNGTFFFRAIATNDNGDTVSSNLAEVLVDTQLFPDLDADGNVNGVDLNIFLDNNDNPPAP